MAKFKKEAVASLLLRLRTAGITDHLLFEAFEAVPRQNFVPLIYIEESYSRGTLPIECGQIMTPADQVAHILLALELDKKQKVLEIGTGTGYQSALIANLAGKITTVDRYRTLTEKAKHRLETLKITNVLVEHKDGSKGIEGGLFDRIVINGAMEEPPKFLSEQLTANGIVLVPVGQGDEIQKMTKMTKIGSRLQIDELFEVRMQPIANGVARAI